MIRSLVVIAVAGVLLAVVCFAVSVSMITRAVAAGSPDVAWWAQRGWNAGEWDMGPTVTIDASGPVVTREVAWNGADKLTLNLPAEVNFTQGPKASVKLSGPQNIVDRVIVEDGKISLPSVRYRNLRGSHLSLDIEAPDVRDFELNTALKIAMRGLDRDEMKIEMNGAADLDAQGRIGSLNLELNGASKADLSQVSLKSARVEANGASAVTAGPTEAADVEINGVGTVTLLNQPKSVKQAIHGLGRVEIGSPSVTGAGVSETHSVSIRRKVAPGVTIEESVSTPAGSRSETKSPAKGDAKDKKA